MNFWGRRAGWFAGPEDGTVEVADSICRLQRLPGWWSAFWTQSPMQGFSLDPLRAGIEHDIMEAFEPGMIIPHTMHYGGYGADHHSFKSPRKTGYEKVRLELAPDIFHVFSMLREEDGYTFYVDGRQHGQKVGTSEGEFVSRAECFALISTELKGFRSRKVEGPMALEPGSSLDAIVDSGDSFEVDYVRVYDEC